MRSDMHMPASCRFRAFTRVSTRVTPKPTIIDLLVLIAIEVYTLRLKLSRKNIATAQQTFSEFICARNQCRQMNALEYVQNERVIAAGCNGRNTTATAQNDSQARTDQTPFALLSSTCVFKCAYVLRVSVWRLTRCARRQRTTVRLQSVPHIVYTISTDHAVLQRREYGIIDDE